MAQEYLDTSPIEKEQFEYLSPQLTETTSHSTSVTSLREVAARISVQVAHYANTYAYLKFHGHDEWSVRIYLAAQLYFKQFSLGERRKLHNQFANAVESRTTSLHLARLSCTNL